MPSPWARSINHVSKFNSVQRVHNNAHHRSFLPASITTGAQSSTFMNAHFKMPFKGQGRVYPSRTCAPTVFGLSSIGSLGQYIGHF